MSETYFSQYGQDKFFDEFVFDKKRGGFFLDIGAHNGVSLSNTCFFEKYRGWNGICIEPLPHIFAQLDKNRSCIKIEGCVSDTDGMTKFTFLDGGEGEFPEMLSGLSKNYDPRHLQRVRNSVEQHNGIMREIEVRSFKINELLKEHNVAFVDYCSIDVEGSEMTILEALNFDLYKIEAFSIENNFQSADIRLLMKSKGYKLLTHMKGDDLFHLQKSRSFWKFW